jgi:alpha-tubulin suppressor-like RCC1 family protein
MVSAGNAGAGVSSEGHTAAIRIDGALFTWGYNNRGQLGDNTTTSKSSPVQIGTSSWTSVSAGNSHTAAIRTDGALFTWGRNTNGQLGDGTTISKSSPVQIGTDSWTYVAAGNFHTSAIRSDGTLFAWGFNTNGQLGDGTAISRSSPVQIGTSSWTSVSAGSAYTAAINNDGDLFTWGLNTSGQLGINSIAAKSSPVIVLTNSTSSSWSLVEAGLGRTFGVTNDGAVHAWGTTNLNLTVPYGLDNPAISISPYRIPNIKNLNIDLLQNTYPMSWTSITTNRVVSSGYNQTIIKDAAGSLYAWGDVNSANPEVLSNFYSDYGVIVTTPDKLFFTTPITTFIDVELGRSNIIAVGIDDSNRHIFFASGDNTYGQLGDGTTVSKSSPVVVTSISGGYSANVYSSTTSSYKQ